MVRPRVSQFIINPRWNGRTLGALHETILLQTFQRGPIQAAGEVKIRRANLVYKTPWEAFMEILRRPDHLPYEKLTENRLFNPRDNRTSLDYRCVNNSANEFRFTSSAI